MILGCASPHQPHPSMPPSLGYPTTQLLAPWPWFPSGTTSFWACFWAAFGQLLGRYSLYTSIHFSCIQARGYLQGWVISSYALHAACPQNRASGTLSWEVKSLKYAACRQNRASGNLPPCSRLFRLSCVFASFSAVRSPPSHAPGARMTVVTLTPSNNSCFNT